MLNTMWSRKLCVVAAASVNSNLCRKLSFTLSFHFCNVFSTVSHSQTLFSQFASTKLNLSEANIARIFKWRPHLQNLRTLENVEKVIHLLEKHGCTEFQVSKIVRKHPQLIESAETILETKLKALKGFGFVGRDLAKLITDSPGFLSANFENNILPKMEFLKNVFRSQDVLIKSLIMGRRLLSYSLENTLKPSLSFWEGWGFSGTDLVGLLKVDPLVLTRTSLLPAQVDLINKIDPDKDSKLRRYIIAIVAMRKTESLVAKIENFKLYGLSAEETFQLYRVRPLLFNFSLENVREKMNFLVNTVELPANYVTKSHKILALNLEKTLRPRFLVWERIKSISDFYPAFSTVVQMPEASFVNNIIQRHPESKALWTIYENAISNASKRTGG